MFGRGMNNTGWVTRVFRNSGMLSCLIEIVSSYVSHCRANPLFQILDHEEIETLYDMFNTQFLCTIERQHTKRLHYTKLRAVLYVLL